MRPWSCEDGGLLVPPGMGHGTFRPGDVHVHKKEHVATSKSDTKEVQPRSQPGDANQSIPILLGWTLQLSHPGMGFNAVPILAVLRDIWATWFGTREWER